MEKTSVILSAFTHFCFRTILNRHQWVKQILRHCFLKEILLPGNEGR